MRFDAVFFDLYGTLLVYGDMTAAWSHWVTTLHGWLREVGLDTDIDELGDRCRGFFSRPEPVPIDSQLTPYENRLHDLCVALGRPVSPAHLTLGADRTASAWQQHIELDPEAPAVLTKIGRDRRLALISNFDHPPHIERVLEETGLRSHFEIVTVSGSLRIKKPDPSVFDPALEALALSPARVAYVGDAPEDVLAAKAAGLTAIRIQRDGETDRDRAADFRHAGPLDWSTTPSHLPIRSLGELLPIVG